MNQIFLISIPFLSIRNKTKAGIEEDIIYQDLDAGRNDHRPGLISCLKALQSNNKGWKDGQYENEITYVDEPLTTNYIKQEILAVNQKLQTRQGGGR